MIHLFTLALRLLFRDWRSGELNILLLALVIAVGSTATTGLFSDRLHRTMSMQAATFLAADLVVTGHTKPSEKWLEKATESHLQTARVSEFSSVIVNQEALLLTGIKAVSDAYPLRGAMKTVQQDSKAEKETFDIPAEGSAWVEQRVLSALGLEAGDSIEVGKKLLRINRVLTYEPDRRGNLLGLTPRVVMNYKDLPATDIIQPGSHVHYYLLFAGPDQTVREFKEWLKPRLIPGQRIMDIHDDRPEIGSAFKRAEKYLGLASVVVVLIAGVAIAMAALRYSRRHFDMTAILRCLGVRQNRILGLFCFQLFMVGVFASLLGCFLGWATQELIVWYIKDLLPKNLLSPGWHAYGMAFFTGLVILAGFTLPPLMQQRKVSPLRVLRRDLIPAPVNLSLIYGLGMLTVGGLVWNYTRDFKLVFYFLGVVLIAILCIGGLVYVFLKSTRKLLPFLGLNNRLGMQQLSRNRISNLIQILAFGVTFTAMIVIYSVRVDLIEAWKEKLPENAPNHFALNIFPSQWQEMRDWFKSQNIEVSAFYPIVRGRLVKINDKNASLVVSSESQAERTLNRDLNLTYTETLPADNQIQYGEWWNENSIDQISIEQSLANSLMVDVGDTLTFSIGSQQIEATVSSIRSVQWDTMKPNFYIIFSPGMLHRYPSTYMTSFYLPPENKIVLNELIERYPSVSVLEVDLIIKQIQTLLAQVTVAVEYVLVFALLAGVFVLFAAVYSGLDERIFNSCILRTLGAGRRVVLQNQCVEFASLGFIAGLLGAISAEILLWVLYERIFELSYEIHWQIWLWTPLVGAIAITVFGLGCTRRAVSQSPLILIRDN